MGNLSGRLHADGNWSLTLTMPLLNGTVDNATSLITCNTQWAVVSPWTWQPLATPVIEPPSNWHHVSGHQSRVGSSVDPDRWQRHRFSAGHADGSATEPPVHTPLAERKIGLRHLSGGHRICALCTVDGVAFEFTPTALAPSTVVVAVSGTGGNSGKR